MATATDTQGKPPAGASNGDLVRWAFGKINEHDIEPLKEFWTPETSERFPDKTATGSEEIAAYFEEVFAAITDFRLEIQALAEDGEDVFVRWHMTGRHTGPFTGIEGTGKEVSIDGIDHFVIRDDKVISNFVVFDRVQFGQQLGMMPPDDSRGDKAMKAMFNAKTKVAAKLSRS
jgi:steroid delta-isomerase-like uncharacterized protein